MGEKEKTVSAKTGTYIGVTDGYTVEFRGVHYAAPVGLWEHPQPLKTTRADVINAKQYGPTCIQPYNVGEPTSTGPTANDCLYLNIATKDNDNKNKPVLLYMHGGSYLTGGGADPITCGRNLVSILPEGEDMVVVTVGYRLGIFGSLDLSLLEGENEYGDTRSLFLEDEIAALRWVYENIEAFGGDPSRITVSGQSAGSMSVLFLIANEEARKYIHGGIAQSGFPTFGMSSPEIKKKLSRNIFGALGIKTVEDFKKTDEQFWRDHYMETLVPNVDLICPRVQDGTAIKEDYWQCIVDGAAKGIPLMIGVGSGEMDLLWKQKDGSLTTADFMMDRLYSHFADFGHCPGQILPADHQDAIDEYMTGHEGEFRRAVDLYAAFATTIGMYNYANEQSRHADTFVYVWDWMPDSNLLTMPEMESHFSPYGRSLHCAELPVLFNSGDVGYECIGRWWMSYLDDPQFHKLPKEVVPYEYALRTAMTWYSFAKNGDPNNDYIPQWPKYDPQTHAHMYMSDEWKIKPDWVIEDMDILLKIKPTPLK